MQNQDRMIPKAVKPLGMVGSIETKDNVCYFANGGLSFQ